MKKNYLSLFLACLLFCAVNSGFSQENKMKPVKKLMILEASESRSLSESQIIFEENLQLSSDNSFEMVTEEADEIGFVHERYQQYYKGLKVEFGSTLLNAKDGIVLSMNNNVFRIDDLSISPQINPNEAFQSAINFVGATSYLWENKGEAMIAGAYEKPEGELVVFPAIVNVSEVNRLAYKFDIYAVEPLYRADVYIDAQTGEFIMENKRIHHANVAASGNSLYNGNVSFTADNASGPYRLRQTADGNGIQTFDLNNGTNYITASDVTSSSTSFSHPTGVQAHFGAEQTHKYFSTNHGRNSYNNAGAIIKSYVSYSNNYVNAFWDGSRMTYGDGDGVNYGPLVSLDIVGHEITHGVTEYSANLVYSYQSGALNESFSDIFGESIEKYASGSNDWLMGDQIGAGGSGGALRSMSNPNIYGDPDTYLGTNWYSGSGDNGGVHYNSGVQNFWFYLLSAGGSGTNDNGNNYAVTGIGMNSAASVAYRNLTVYLSANSQYSDARNGAIQAAIDLFGAGSQEEISVTNAWYAVGVGAAYNDTPPPPPGCEVGDIYLTITLDNYPEETAWTLKNAIGTTVASASYSSANPDGSTVNAIFAGLAAGNYTFTITDSYGDGICCSYGIGSYTLSSAAGVIVSGGNFGSSQATAFCIEVAGPVPDTEAPTVPGALAATAITQTTATLSWNASSDNVGVTGYEILQGSTSLGSVVGTSANLINLIANTGYTFSVRAFDAAGNNSGIANVSFTTLNNVPPPDTQAPSVPTGLSASNIAQTTATLSWNASSDNVGVTGYEILQGSTSIGTVTGTSTNLSNLTANTGYTFSVRAFDAAGNNSATSSVSFTTLSNGGPVSDILHQGFFESGWDGWTDGGSDAYRYAGSRSFQGLYSIRLRDNTSSSTMTLGSFNVTAYSTIDVEFYFYSYSFENGEDFWLQYYDGSSWNTVASYARGVNFNNNTFYTTTVTISNSNYTFPTNAQFRFRCDASDNGDNVYIDQVTITANGGASIAGMSINNLGSMMGFTDDFDDADGDEFESDFLLYPNPVVSELKIGMVDLSAQIDYRIFNIAGQIMLVGNLTTGSINVEELQNGVYILELNDGEEIMTKRFIKK